MKFIKKHQMILAFTCAAGLISLLFNLILNILEENIQSENLLIFLFWCGVILWIVITYFVDALIELLDDLTTAYKLYKTPKSSKERIWEIDSIKNKLHAMQINLETKNTIIRDYQEEIEKLQPIYDRLKKAIEKESV